MKFHFALRAQTISLVPFHVQPSHCSKLCIPSKHMGKYSEWEKTEKKKIIRRTKEHGRKSQM
jgi:hypothetical protein